MTIAKDLQQATSRLEAVSPDEARLEAEMLLCHALGIGRSELLVRIQKELPQDRRRDFVALVERRLAHEPTPYIIGHREFYGLDFACSPAALIPRPETELLVETAIEWLEEQGPGVESHRVVDVGTGTGAIAVALAKNLPDLRILATDTSRDALLLARQNAEAHDVTHRVDLVECSLLEPIRALAELIIANLPYIPTRTYNTLPAEIREHEPEDALRAGRRGTSAIEALLEESFGILAPGGLLLAEHGWNQGKRLRDAARVHYPTAQIETYKDLAGLDRMLVVRN